MRILVIADIHSNYAALRAIPKDFDHCVVVGDVVDYGTAPNECLGWVQEHADVCVRGNHDHAVAHKVVTSGTSGFRRLAGVVRPYHWEVLDSHQLKTMSRFPVSSHYQVDELRLFLIHATPRDPMDEYLGADEAGWRQQLSNIRADIVCVGHTHQQFHLKFDQIQVLNPGSVGQPRDGDWRTAYAVIEDGKVSLHRVEYDLDEAVAQMRRTSLPPWAVALNEAILRTGGGLTREEMDSFQ